jgi:hypothetical protein
LKTSVRILFAREVLRKLVELNGENEFAFAALPGVSSERDEMCLDGWVVSIGGGMVDATNSLPKNVTISSNDGFCPDNV